MRRRMRLIRHVRRPSRRWRLMELPRREPTLEHGARRTRTGRCVFAPTELLGRLEPKTDASTMAAIAPAPGAPIAPYDDPALIAPTNSPHVFIETAYGTIEFELAVLDAPQTSRNFMTLARKGFFNGSRSTGSSPNFVVQDGDPRGDGEGGPGYTIRDEINERPYLRGTVGMALDWRDTGGSQFFITHSPQPHLDARYTVVRPRRERHGRRRSDRAGGCDPADAGVGRKGLASSVTRCERRYRAKRGRRPAPPILAGRSGLPLLAALLLPALGCFLCHCAYPPFHSWDLLRWALTALQRRGLLARRPASVSAPRFFANSRVAREVVHQKKGVSLLDTPGPVGGRLALLPALFLAALRSLLRHYSSLERGSSASLPVTRVTTGGLSGPPSYKM